MEKKKKSKRNFLKDRRGVSNTTVAFLASIVVLLIYWGIMNSPGGPEFLFYILYLFLRTVGVVGEDFDKFVEDVRSTLVWSLLTLVGSQVGIVLVVAMTFASTWWTVGIAQKVLAWRKARRERQQKNLEEDERKRKLRRDKLEREDEARFTIQQELTKISKLGSVPSSSTKKTKSKANETVGRRKLFDIEWSHIPKNQVLTLEGGKLIDIIQEAKSFFPTKMKPQGSYVELAKALDIDRSTLYKLSKRGSNSMTVESLVKILNIIKAPHDILTPYIK